MATNRLTHHHDRSQAAARHDGSQAAAGGVAVAYPGGALRRRVRVARWSLHTALGEHAAYLPLARARHGDNVLADETELLIDGFPRSASTFAVVGFQLAQPRPVRLAHHLHVPAHIIAAIRMGTPTLVTIRNPEDVVVSAVIREPFLTPRHVVAAYTRFYRALLPYRAEFVVAEFKETTTRLGDVIDRLNRRFGTEFRRFEHTELNVREAFAIIEDRARRPPWGKHVGMFLSGRATAGELQEARDAAQAAAPPVREAGVSRPSLQRARAKHRVRAQYESRSLARLRAGAEEVYAAYTAAPG
jgi:hypothetical protein